MAMDDEQIRIEHQIDWLKNASPDDWHRVALDFNWDERIDPLRWIVEQPECDKATALTIFWLGQPAYFLMEVAEKGGADDAQNPVWDMLKYIAQRINEKGYHRAQIAYDATPHANQDFRELAEYAGQLTHSPLKPHPDMKRSIRGRAVQNDPEFYRRYPEDFHHSVLIELPPVDWTTMIVPEMKAARFEATALIANLLAIGFLIVYWIYFIPTNSRTLITSAGLLFALSYGLYSSASSLRTLRGLLPSDRLRLSPAWLGITAMLSILVGAGLALAFGQIAVEQMQALSQSHGKAVLVVAALIVGLPVTYLIGWLLAPLLINNRALS